MLRKNIMILLFVTLAVFLLGRWIVVDKEYTTLEDVEKLMIENGIEYESKPIEDNKRIDFAVEQKIYTVDKNTDIYVYLVDPFDLEKADLLISNALLPNHYIVSSTEKYLFAYPENNLEKYQSELFQVIDELIESERQ